MRSRSSCLPALPLSDLGEVSLALRAVWSPEAAQDFAVTPRKFIDICGIKGGHWLP